MSSGKAFPRMFIRSEFVGKNCYKPDLDGWTNYEKTDEREEYLSMKEYSALMQSKDKKIERLTEALRKCVLWAESASMKLENRNEINWTYLNDAREALAGGKDGNA